MGNLEKTTSFALLAMTAYTRKMGLPLYYTDVSGLTDASSNDANNDEEYTRVKTKNSSSVLLEAPVNKRWSFVILIGFFSIALTILYLTYRSFPQLQE